MFWSHAIESCFSIETNAYFSKVDFRWKKAYSGRRQSTQISHHSFIYFTFVLKPLKETNPVTTIFLLNFTNGSCNK